MRSCFGRMTDRDTVRHGIGALALLGVLASWGAPMRVGAVTVPAHGRSPGCTRGAARTRPPSGDVASTVNIGGITHRYLVSVPAHYQAKRPAPLVLLFHGFGSDAPAMADLTHLPAQGAAGAFIVVTPDGPGQTWQLSGTGSDAAYVDTLVSTVSSAWCVDPRRVYAAGFSQGAAFAIFYSCARPGRIAAIATVAVEFQLGCKRPVPILAFHGTADPAVPYQDGAIGLSLPGVKVRGSLLNMGDWAQLDGCHATPTAARVDTDVTRTTWPHCREHTAVVLYTIAGGGHSWPGADPTKNPTPTTQQVHATTLMLSFFDRHHP